jgi:hypothetical protein
MSQLRAFKKPPASSLASRRPRLEIPRLAHNRALHFLANHPTGDELREQLTEVVHGFTGRCNEPLARAGLEWLRERYRRRGEVPPF